MYEKILKPRFASNAIFLLLLGALFCCLSCLSGCSKNAPENPQLLQTASAAAAKGSGLWSKPFKGIDATLRPDSSAYGGHNFVLNAVYRVVSPDEARFAVFLPQGNKLGQCVRKGRDVSCSGLSFPGAGSLIRSSFAALDEMVLSAPGEDDSYELSYGDRNTDICGERLVLRRKRSAQAGASYVITEPDGVPVSAYRRGKSSSSSLGEDASSRIDAWRIMFSGKPGNYRFMPQGNNWMIDVSIVRFVE